jgi:hypothetical protein
MLTAVRAGSVVAEAPVRPTISNARTMTALPLKSKPLLLTSTATIPRTDPSPEKSQTTVASSTNRAGTADREEPPKEQDSVGLGKNPLPRTVMAAGRASHTLSGATDATVGVGANKNPAPDWEHTPSPVHTRTLCMPPSGIGGVMQT